LGKIREKVAGGKEPHKVVPVVLEPIQIELPLLVVAIDIEAALIAVRVDALRPFNVKRTVLITTP
jgi:hypothetical protein